MGITYAIHYCMGDTCLYKPILGSIPVVKPANPAKASPQERLETAFAHLLAQGEQITRTRLR
jgi:hypothetical protein